MSIAQPPGVDLSALRAWTDGQDLGSGPIEDVRQLTGGTTVGLFEGALAVIGA